MQTISLAAQDCVQAKYLDIKRREAQIKKITKIFFYSPSQTYLCTRKSKKAYGTLTEWLGSGLQNRLQQFESARYLISKIRVLNVSKFRTLFFFLTFSNFSVLK